MLYVFETSEGRVFIAAENKVEKVKAELDKLGEAYDMYASDDIEVRGHDLEVKYYGAQFDVD